MSSPPVLCYRGRWREGPHWAGLICLLCELQYPRLLSALPETATDCAATLQEELFWSWMLLTVARVMATRWHCSAWKDGRLLGHAQKTYTWRQACATELSPLKLCFVRKIWIIISIFLVNIIIITSKSVSLHYWERGLLHTSRYRKVIMWMTNKNAVIISSNLNI